MKIAITGTPGTGKTSIAKMIGRAMNAPVIDANAIAIQNGCVIRKNSRGESIIDVRKLRTKLIDALTHAGENAIVEGHLVCEFPLPVDIVLVVRTHPRLLQNRLKKRTYSQEKIDENVLTEILDYCTSQALVHYRRADVIDIDSSKRVTIARVQNALRTRKSDAVNWMPLLLTPSFAPLLHARNAPTRKPTFITGSR